MNLEKTFISLGLQREHAKIYDVLLKNGRLRAAELARKAGIPRTTCYEYFPVLIELGVILESQEGKSRYFVAEDPKRLVNLAYKKLNEVNYEITNLESNFDTLTELYSANYSVNSVTEINSEREFFDRLSKVKSDKDIKIFVGKNPKRSKLMHKFLENARSQKSIDVGKLQISATILLVVESKAILFDETEQRGYSLNDKILHKLLVSLI